MLLTGALLFALAASEALGRALFPLSDGLENVDMNGKRITGWFTPGSIYRQISNEYDAVTTITSQGHRVPGGDGSPDVIFLGDSFTFGFGLADDETFASIYCKQLRRACANLGIPGSGTSRQVARLKDFIEKWHWKPRQVKLFFFGMSGSFSAGNDFVDNYNYARFLEGQAAGGVRPPEPAPSLTARVIGAQTALMERSYLMRRAKYHWGPMLKSMIVDDPGLRMTTALESTRKGFEELDALSKKAGFEYVVYLIVPVQDVIRGSYPQTLAALNSVSGRPAIETAYLYLDRPARFYFAFDGHLNPLGSRTLAEFLIGQDRSE